MKLTRMQQIRIRLARLIAPKPFYTLFVHPTELPLLNYALNFRRGFVAGVQKQIAEHKKKHDKGSKIIH